MDKKNYGNVICSGDLKGAFIKRFYLLRFYKDFLMGILPIDEGGFFHYRISLEDAKKFENKINSLNYKDLKIEIEFFRD